MMFIEAALIYLKILPFLIEWHEFGGEKITPQVKNVEIKNIGTTINAAPAHFFTSTA